jgi:Ni/Co efflux regulator RcnB
MKKLILTTLAAFGLSLAPLAQGADAPAAGAAQVAPTGQESAPTVSAKKGHHKKHHKKKKGKQAKSGSLTKT